MAGISGGTEKRLRALSEAARSSAQQAADDRQARDSAIMEADHEGAGLREVARATGMSTSHISRIIITESAKVQEQPEND